MIPISEESNFTIFEYETKVRDLSSISIKAFLVRLVEILLLRSTGKLDATGFGGVDLRRQKARSTPQRNIVKVAMGSLATEGDDGEREISVLVTGFGVRHSP